MEDHYKDYYAPTSSLTINDDKYIIEAQKSYAFSDLNYRLIHPGIPKIPGANTVKNSARSHNSPLDEDQDFEDCDECKESSEPYCHVKLNSILKLKSSTKKLLTLLDEIQAKIHGKTEILTLEHFVKSKQFVPASSTDVSDSISIPALRKLEAQAHILEGIYPDVEEDDCSVYKRLTGKCHCLNQVDYNDFIIHFNEETKYSTSHIGELIKNIRILKRFLYLGGNYTKNALMFLNEGFSNSSTTEKIEITQGCTHADICNLFGEHSLVIMCISWPCKHFFFGDATTQGLASRLLLKLAEIEEGRRYLNYSSKITNDIRKVVRKKSTALEVDVIDTLTEILNLLKPPFIKNLTASCLNKSVYEGFGYKTVNDLLKFRQHMTLDEMLCHLDLLENYSKSDNGKVELTNNIPSVVVLFKNMLMEFDNSEINIIITNILHNIVSKSIAKAKEQEATGMAIADVGTEPIKMKHETVQMPPKQKNNSKKPNKQKNTLGLAPTKNRQALIHQAAGWEPAALLNRSKKFTKELRRSIIVVPIENNYEEEDFS